MDGYPIIRARRAHRLTPEDPPSGECGGLEFDAAFPGSRLFSNFSLRNREYTCTVRNGVSDFERRHGMCSSSRRGQGGTLQAAKCRRDADSRLLNLKPFAGRGPNYNRDVNHRIRRLALMDGGVSGIETC
jgi:hypothetical protein